MSERAAVHLVDASPYLFRAYFALPDLRAPDGRSVSAVLGFGDFLLRLVQDESPTHVALCFDESLETSFRNALYPPYKAQREKAPAELVEQIARCVELAGSLGFACFSSATFEADDLVASLAEPLVRDGHALVVVTSDKDLAQLVSDDVTWLDLARGTRLAPDDVRARFGVRPAQIPDWLGLAGDAVDAIPGVAGIGAKTAAALLAAYDDLDALYAHLDQVPALPLRGAASVARKLEAGRELAFLSRTLATVSRDAPVDARPETLRLQGVDEPRLLALAADLGMQRLVTRVAAWARR